MHPIKLRVDDNIVIVNLGEIFLSGLSFGTPRWALFIFVLREVLANGARFMVNYELNKTLSIPGVLRVRGKNPAGRVQCKPLQANGHD